MTSKFPFLPLQTRASQPRACGQCTSNDTDNSASFRQWQQHFRHDQKTTAILKEGPGCIRDPEHFAWQIGWRLFLPPSPRTPSSVSLCTGPKQASVSIAISRAQSRSWGLTRIRAGGTPDPIHIANMDAHHLDHASPPSVALFPRYRPHQSTSTHSFTPWPNQLPRSHWPTAP